RVQVPIARGEPVEVARLATRGRRCPRLRGAAPGTHEGHAEIQSYVVGVRQIVLLRGINIGPRNRIAMPALSELFTTAGFDDVRTYLQSGNVVLSSDAESERLAQECERRIAQAFGLNVDVIVRTRDELAGVVRRNPLEEVAVNPKRYQVTFLQSELMP